MQEPSRSNRERTEKTRSALVSAGRALFVEKGYADTSTPEIVAAVGITRGALYHHFEDKRALFRAVVADEAREVARAIEQRTPAHLTPTDALVAGSEAYFDAMRVPGRTRLLLIEGPSVLGAVEMKSLDEENAGRTLREGLVAAISGKPTLSAEQLTALTDLLSAAFDRAALAVAGGEDDCIYRSAIVLLIHRIVAR
jgi:AcrR family transcriptional regulator